MQTIVLIMRREPIAQAFIKRLLDNADIAVIHAPDYGRADRIIHEHSAGAALVEVGETSGYDTAHCLALCKRLRDVAPQCKLILMCPEQNGASVQEAVKAKKDRRIDDFVFYDASLDYLTSKLLSML
ncbi:hypothetical protein LJC27_06320 [Christensenellaceae bacterium OttesenSCG-928-M15]|nr:hypothetical protein [Christensenellaceae bacterium OttesenSCG-928-M15]